MQRNRGFFRKVVQIPVTLSYKNARQKRVVYYEEKAMMLDLSVAGAYLVKAPGFTTAEIKALLEKKAKLTLEFLLPGNKIAIICTARARWVESNDKFSSKMTALGVEFDDISKEDIMEIIRYLSGEKKEKEFKRREFLRIKSNIPIKFKTRFNSHISNISMGGICLQVEPSLGRLYTRSLLDKVLKMKIRVLGKRIPVEGKLKWVGKSKVNDQKVTNLGIEFNKIDSLDRKYISKYVLLKQLS